MSRPEFDCAANELAEARAEKAEARVAELERQLSVAHNEWHIGPPFHPWQDCESLKAPGGRDKL